MNNDIFTNIETLFTTLEIIKKDLEKFVYLYNNVTKGKEDNNYIKQISENLTKVGGIIKEIKILGSYEYEYTAMCSGSTKTLNKIIDKSKLLKGRIDYIKSLVYNLSYSKLIEDNKLNYLYNFISDIVDKSERL